LLQTRYIPNPEYIFPFDVLCVPKAQVNINESNNGGVVSLGALADE
jgi:hypothetical protein